MTNTLNPNATPFTPRADTSDHISHTTGVTKSRVITPSEGKDRIQRRQRKKSSEARDTKPTKRILKEEGKADICHDKGSSKRCRGSGRYVNGGQNNDVEASTLNNSHMGKTSFKDVLLKVPLQETLQKASKEKDGWVRCGISATSKESIESSTEPPSFVPPSNIAPKPVASKFLTSLRSKPDASAVAKLEKHWFKIAARKPVESEVAYREDAAKSDSEWSTEWISLKSSKLAAEDIPAIVPVDLTPITLSFEDWETLIAEDDVKKAGWFFSSGGVFPHMNDTSRGSLLHLAASKSPRVLQYLLLNFQLNLDARDSCKRTPLHVACENASLEVKENF